MLAKVRSLNFDINYNNKFLCFCFVIVRENKKYDEILIGETIQIKIRQTHFCFADVIKKEILSLDQITDRGLNFLDLGLSEKEYKESWPELAQKKLFEVLYLKKITQLDLFNNYEL